MKKLAEVVVMILLLSLTFVSAVCFSNFFISITPNLNFDTQQIIAGIIMILMICFLAWVNAILMFKFVDWIDR